MYLYKTMGKGSARTLQHWLDKGYSIEKSEEMRRSRTPGTLEYFTIYKKLPIEEAIIKRDEYNKKSAPTLKNMIIKYGEDEGQKRWDIYIQKQAYTNSFEYKKEKYGWSLEDWETYNKSRGSFGEKNGNYGSSYYEVWVEKYGKDEADRMNYEVGKLKARNGELNGNYGRIKRPEEIERMKHSAINRVIRQGTYVSYNPNSISIIEEYGKTHGYNFQHAENGGEYQVPTTTFFVDGYDVINNVVIEFDENYHSTEKQRIKDIQRQDMIGQLLKCKFIRIDKNNNINIFDYSE
jgi:hypothetical protein